ncbi:phosphatidylserine decarboxylase-domain-containing protein [Camillea tinctor]|nr:phosphatidylserine decarboxylase-domain-containing protein [Camillea tinctor]
MLGCFAKIITGVAPEWNANAEVIGLIGFPFNAILDWPIATQSGYAFFLKPEVNQKFKGGWLSEEALKKLEEETNGQGHQGPVFQDLFKCDPIGDPDHWGFKSWDSFFVREFKDIDKIRPVAYKDDPKCIGQLYSVAEMLKYCPGTSKFVGGTVYQAFLSALAYHRWNSPVKGNIIYSNIIDGTYVFESTITGFTNMKDPKDPKDPEDPKCPTPDPDPAGTNKAQGYFTHVATRAIFLIDAGDPIGLMACLYVGMADISTCEILEKFQRHNLPQTVEKGEELGMFHHSGSTHCLIFREGLKLKWVDAATPPARARKVLRRRQTIFRFGAS